MNEVKVQISPPSHPEEFPRHCARTTSCAACVILATDMRSSVVAEALIAVHTSTVASKTTIMMTRRPVFVAQAILPVRSPWVRQCLLRDGRAPLVNRATARFILRTGGAGSKGCAPACQDFRRVGRWPLPLPSPLNLSRDRFVISFHLASSHLQHPRGRRAIIVQRGDEQCAHAGQCGAGNL